MLQEGQQYSRLALVLNVVIYILLTYLVRELWKHLLRKKMEDGENRSLLLVVSADVVSSVVESMKEHNYARYKIAGIAVIDKEMTGKYIDGVKVVANMENAAEYVCKEWIDEVLIVTSGVVQYPKELIEQFTETGVTVHLNLAKVQSVPGKKQFVEKIGDYTVLTTSINYASTRDLMLKRLMDTAEPCGRTDRWIYLYDHKYQYSKQCSDGIKTTDRYCSRYCRLCDHRNCFYFCGTVDL